MQVDITDARTLQPSFDEEGFELHQIAHDEIDFLKHADVVLKYYPVVADLVRKITGAKDVFCFDHNLRKSKSAPSQSRGVCFFLPRALAPSPRALRRSIDRNNNLPGDEQIVGAAVTIQPPISLVHTARRRRRSSSLRSSRRFFFFHFLGPSTRPPGGRLFSYHRRITL